MKSKSRSKALRRKGINPHLHRNRDCDFCNQNTDVSYRDVEVLKEYTTKTGRVVPSTSTGTCRKHQNQLSTAVKTARELGLIDFTINNPISLFDLRKRR